MGKNGKHVRWNSDVIKHSLDYDTSLESMPSFCVNPTGSTTRRSDTSNPLRSKTRSGTSHPDKKNRSLLISVLVYGVFLCIVFYLSYASKDKRGYFLSQAARNEAFSSNNGISFATIHSTSDYWQWLHTTILPALYASTSPVPDIYTESAYTKNLLNWRVGVARLRQHRVKYGPCLVSPDNTALTKSYCEPPYTSNVADNDNLWECWRTNITTHSEQYNLRNAKKTVNGSNVTSKTLKIIRKTNNTSHSDIKTVKTPWSYQTWRELKGVPYMGVRSVYGGGGYVINFKHNVEDTIKELNLYEEKKWLDERTRAVMLEFTLYNANVNLFLSVTMLVEFLTTGSTVTHSNFRVFRLFDFIGSRGNLDLSLEIVYCCYILYFTIVLGLAMIKQKCRFFHKFWNVVALCRITLGVVCIALYAFKQVLTRYIREWLKDPSPTEPFLNLQTFATYDEIYTYALALVVFLATLQFLKLLQFNKRLRMLGDVLHISYTDLRNFSLMFFVFIFSFSMCAFLLFGRVSVAFYNFAATVESLFTVALGDFSYEEIRSTQMILAPLFFFTYIIVIYVVLMTIFLSILNKAIAEVRYGETNRHGRYHMLDYIKRLVLRVYRYVRSVGSSLFRSMWHGIEACCCNYRSSSFDSSNRFNSPSVSPQWGEECHYNDNIQDHHDSMFDENNNKLYGNKVVFV